jgi:hypothetical protein
VWGAASEDLDATILVWPSGEGPGEHVNESRDEAAIVPKGARRGLVAGPDGVTYATAHVRRPGLEIRALPPQA